MEQRTRTKTVRIVVALMLAAISATANAVTDNSTITIGSKITGFGTWYGFDAGIFGSISPTTMANGKGYVEWYDIPGTMNSLSYFALSPFTSDPGQAYLTSAKCFSVTKTGSSATYTYSGGVAKWYWVSAFGFSGHTTASCTVIHN